MRRLALDPEDIIVVKVILRTTDDPNHSDIQREWKELLADWTSTNGCDVQHIEWQRFRKRVVKIEGEDPELYWDRVEERK